MRRSMILMTAIFLLMGLSADPSADAARGAAVPQIVFRSAAAPDGFSPLTGRTIAGAVTVTVSSANSAQSARFALINGTANSRTAIKMVTPTQATLNTAALANGRHVLTARISDTNGGTVDVKAAFIVRKTTSVRTNTSNPRPYPTEAIAVYYMMWPDSGSPPLTQLPREVNVVNLAFAQGDPPALVGWTAQGKAAFLKDVATVRARGTRFIVSIGGAGGKVNTSNTAAFVEGVVRIHKELPLDGIDWDIEGEQLRADDVVTISQSLRQRLGKNFAVTMAPNGSNVDQYLPVAKRLADTGALTMYGQQFYDAPVTLTAAQSRIDQAIKAGIPETRMAAGMMLGSGANYWTLPQAQTNARAMKASYPRMRGTYLWEASRPGTQDWAKAMAATFNTR